MKLKVINLILGIVLILGTWDRFVSFIKIHPGKCLLFTGIRRVREGLVEENKLRIDKILNSKSPLTEEEIDFFISKVRIRGLTIDEIVNRFFYFKNGMIYLNQKEADDFMYSPEFKYREKSYPFEYIGSSAEKFMEFLRDLRCAARWQNEYPEVFNKEEYGKYGIIIALAANIYNLSDIGRFMLYDPLSSPKTEIIRPLIVGKLFTEGVGRLDKSYRGKYYKVIEEEIKDRKMTMVVEMENIGLLPSGKVSIKEVYIKDNKTGEWIAWIDSILGREIDVVTIHRTNPLFDFLNNLTK